MSLSRTMSARTLLIAPALLLLIGCNAAGGGSGKYVGSWRDQANPEMKIEKMKNRTFIVQGMGQEVEGTWEVLDDGRVRQRAEVYGTTRVMTSTAEWLGKDIIKTVGSSGVETIMVRD